MAADERALAERRVLIVPVTRRDGEVTAELLRKVQVTCEPCATLERLGEQMGRGVGAMILSDVALAEPSIGRLLGRLAEQPAWSDVPVIVLAQDRAQPSAVSHALRVLSNVTLLDRPTSTRTLVSAVLAALRARERQYQIRDQLDALSRADAAVRDSARRLALGIEVSRLALVEMDPARDGCELSEGAARLFGFGDAATRQPCHALLERVHPDDRERVAAWAAESLRGPARRAAPIDYRIVRPDGQVRWVSERRQVFFGADGKPSGATIAALDITERKRGEDTERSFKAFFESAPGMFLVLDPQLRIVGATDAYLQATGTHRAAIVGRDLFEVLPAARDERHADALASLKRSLEHVRSTKSIDTMSVLRLPVPGPAADGSGFVERFWSPVNSPVLDAQGELSYIIHRVEDVTDYVLGQRDERVSAPGSRIRRIEAEIVQRGQELQQALQQARRSEQLFRAMANSIPQLAWMARPDGDVYWYNDRWRDFTGTTRHEMLERGWRAFHHPDHRARVDERLKASFASGQPWEDSFPLRARDGTFRWFLARAVPVRSREGEIEQWLCTCTDMTQQRAAEEALRDADRRKDEFLATLAHELRNPLAPIRTGLQLLAKQPSGRSAAQLLPMMERQLSLLVRLIDDLLDVSRIATGNVVLRRERVDLRAVVEAGLEGCQPMVQAAQHTLRVELPAQPVWVVGDASRLSQVVSNLVSNAAKYTPQRGAIGVELAGDGGDAVIRVSDNGLGIPPDMLSRVFDMFAQVNRTLDRAQGGLGIGLSLVRRLMELHGGSVSVHSAGVDCGSTFTVRLPALDSDAALTPVAAPGAAPRAQRRLRILIVDDNSDAADALALLLQADGHETRVEYTGTAALRAAAEFRPGVVLCDIGLPGIDGHEVAGRLRAEPQHASTLLVALTGWGSEDDLQRSHRAGFDFHLTKPVSSDALERILARV